GVSDRGAHPQRRVLRPRPGPADAPDRGPAAAARRAPGLPHLRGASRAARSAPRVPRVPRGRDQDPLPDPDPPAEGRRGPGLQARGLPGLRGAERAHRVAAGARVPHAGRAAVRGRPHPGVLSPMKKATNNRARSQPPRRGAPRPKSDIGLRGLAPELLVDLYVTMRRIRRAEETIAALYPEQEIRCPTHLSIGQEAGATGVSLALRITD